MVTVTVPGQSPIYTYIYITHTICHMHVVVFMAAGCLDPGLVLGREYRESACHKFVHFLQERQVLGALARVKCIEAVLEPLHGKRNQQA